MQICRRNIKQRLATAHRVRSGEQPQLTVREKHTRDCYVVAEEGADLERIAHEINELFRSLRMQICRRNIKQRLATAHSFLIHPVCCSCASNQNPWLLRKVLIWSALRMKSSQCPITLQNMKLRFILSAKRNLKQPDPIRRK